ncbi:amino acid adenylation domain-containing protein [Micromonospora maritima]|uniref:Amino acid adenylation domain-containing protein n=1 Tax=Micromonospora maritima TaxID=986711 RepID=A0ABW7ZT67_9ACTN
MTTVHAPAVESISGRLAWRVAAHPDRCALVCGDQRLSYGDLAEYADRIGRALHERGVRRGDTVAVFARRSPALIATMIAVLGLGAAYVALDRRWPAARRELIVRDAAVRAVVTDAPGDLALPPGCGALCLVDGVPAPGSSTAAPSGILDDRIGGADPAYIAYTSGTTGRPKGVIVPHRAVLRLVDDRTFLDLAEDEVFLQFAPVAFDASTWEIWTPLLTGGCLVVAPEDVRSVTDLVALAHEAGVTRMWLTAGLFQQLSAEHLPSLTGLRQLVAGGDVLPPSQVERLLAVLPATSLVNGYGPTENTTFTCCHRIMGPTGGSAVPIGRPINGTEVYILDANLCPVPAGEVGELYAGGSGLAHGYLGGPSLTANRFVADPVSGTPGARLYRTGDLAYQSPDGTVHFVGRADGQVKIRGFRVELGEVEAAVAALDGVAEVAVVSQPAGSSGRRLAAFVVLDPSASPASPMGIRAALAGSLPEYMVPSSITLLGELPLTSQGKIDRPRLAETLVRTRPPVNAAYRPPATDLERAISQQWADHLLLEEVGADDDFFELGGHSLLAVTMIEEIQRVYGVLVNAIDFYLNPSPAGVARVLSETAIEAPR